MGGKESSTVQAVGRSEGGDEGSSSKIQKGGSRGERCVSHRILVADDETASRHGLAALLGGWGYEVAEAADGQEALDKARTFRPSLVIADLVMPGLDGLQLLQALCSDLPFAVMILLTGHGSVETAVGAMKQGAYDYLTKPVDVKRLRVLVERALEKGETVQEVTLLRRRLKELWGLGRLVGKSVAMQEVYRLLELAAPTSAAVLITGESGTGKELAARALHELSPRVRQPFVAINCSAIPETLLESEIFGHEKGAFTGAIDRRPGCFEMAHGGTLFLDEIAEMAPGLQAKFLRILQDGSVRRLGGKTEFQVDVRVIAATNKNLQEAVQSGSLREDLYYRLNVVRLHLPALRDRREDIPLLVQTFIEEFNEKHGRHIRALTDEAQAVLLGHAWSGNVRELRNSIEHAVVLCQDEWIGTQQLPQDLGAARRDLGPETVAFPVGTTVEEAERALILKTLQSVGNNKTKAAEILGISLKTLHNKLNRYGG
ncbi:MAG: sigma-54-dependent Fis family transcriptional regulator [candidate division NC10 bacterium]|nr:sigma-54-dependent Fis family transcriptional regulator [candidate division NC10 bacterium]